MIGRGKRREVLIAEGILQAKYLLSQARDGVVSPAQVRHVIGDLVRRVRLSDVEVVLRLCGESLLGVLDDPSRVAVQEWLNREFAAELSAGRQPRLGARLVFVAARVLPVSCQARYREEFAAELAEIAPSGRFRQFRYGVSVLGRALPLRWELRRPARERAR